MKHLRSNTESGRQLNCDHVLMAPHENLCTDDLQTVFELAESVFAQESRASPNESESVLVSEWVCGILCCNLKFSEI